MEQKIIPLMIIFYDSIIPDNNVHKLKIANDNTIFALVGSGGINSFYNQKI
jgi:hypothetical protein